METRQLGDTDLFVSIAGLGCNNFGWFVDRARSLDVLAAAFEGGVTFYDTANNYGMPPGESERLVGEAFAGKRDRVVIATKVGDQVGEDPADRGAAPAYIRKSIERSLRDLRTDYIDLYQLHYPDPTVHLDETLRAFEDLVREGKIRHIGCANHDARQLGEALDISRQQDLPRFSSCQVEYSLVARDAEAEIVPVLARERIGLLPYFPLANGLLTGKYIDADGAGGRLETIRNIPFFDRFLTEARHASVARAAAIARETGFSMVDLALGWLASRPQVASIIAGATRPEQVLANIAACNTALPDGVLARLDDLALG